MIQVGVLEYKLDELFILDAAIHFIRRTLSKHPIFNQVQLSLTQYDNLAQVVISTENSVELSSQDCTNLTALVSGFFSGCILGWYKGAGAADV